MIFAYESKKNGWYIFSGTGNSKYAAQLFCKEYDSESETYSIEDSEALTAATDADLIIFAYPVQFSTVPKIMRDYITDHNDLWMNKKVFIIANERTGRKFAELIGNDGMDIAVVPHGFYMHTLLREMKKMGFRMTGSSVKYKNGEYVIAEK